MLTREIAISEGYKFLQLCEMLPIKINRFILFGSVINNSINRNSDIDIALISENFTENNLSNMDLISSVAIKFPDFDIHTFSKKEYDNGGLLIDEVKRSGLELA